MTITIIAMLVVMLLTMEWQFNRGESVDYAATAGADDGYIVARVIIPITSLVYKPKIATSALLSLIVVAIKKTSL